MKITAVKTLNVNVPMDKPIRWATGGITHVGECYVRILTDEGVEGLGFTYPNAESRDVIENRLKPLLLGRNPLEIEGLWHAMFESLQQAGQAGITLNAVSAVDIALWDLKAKFLGLPLYSLLGAYTDSMPVYGSGGFISYSTDELVAQMAGFAARGIGAVKMKIGIERGRNERLDLERVAAVRQAIGDKVDLLVDANGAYTARQAIGVSKQLEQYGVAWFEEPVIATDMSGLAAVSRATTIPVATGEFEYSLMAFKALMQQGGVDIVQADAGRVGGVTGWRKIAHLAEAYGLPLAPHSFDLLHLHLCCATPNSRILEHLPIFDTLPYQTKPEVVDGRLRPSPTLAGHGLVLDEERAKRYAS